MSTRNWIAVGLTLVSMALIIPGLRSDALTITATMPLLKKPLYEETQSILRAIRRLYDSKNYFVAGLVLLFSVIVPFIKAAILAVIMLSKNPTTKYRLYLFVRSVSKWAMADVFAVGVFIAFMAGNAIDNLDAKLHPGFYWFIAYCLISNLSFQFLHVPPPDQGSGIGDQGSGIGDLGSGRREPSFGSIVLVHSAPEDESSERAEPGEHVMQLSEIHQLDQVAVAILHKEEPLPAVWRLRRL